MKTFFEKTTDTLKWTLPSTFKIETKNVCLLLFQGKPIAEPFAKYLPFVMNTKEKVQQVMKEYRLTQFNGWSWSYPDYVY